MFFFRFLKMQLSGISKLLVGSLVCLDFCLGSLFSNWVPNWFAKVARKLPKSGLKRGSKNAAKNVPLSVYQNGVYHEKISVWPNELRGIGLLKVFILNKSLKWVQICSRVTKNYSKISFRWVKKLPQFSQECLQHLMELLWWFGVFFQEGLEKAPKLLKVVSNNVSNGFLWFAVVVWILTAVSNARMMPILFMHALCSMYRSSVIYAISVTVMLRCFH